MKAMPQRLASAFADSSHRPQAKLLATLLAFACVGHPVTIEASSSRQTGGLPAAAPATVQEVAGESVRLTGHGVPLDNAVASTAALPSTLAVTLTLRRENETDFQRYLHDVYDPKSPVFHRFLTPAQASDRFGPSRQAYDEVLAYLRSRNLELVSGSTNRMTLTVRGALADVEDAFAVAIGTYARGSHDFYANAADPALPDNIATHVRAVTGLSNLARPVRIGALEQLQEYGEGGGGESSDETLALTCELGENLDPVDTGLTAGIGITGAEGLGGLDFSVSFVETILHYQCAADELNLVAAYAASVGSAASRRPPPLIAAPASTAPGSGQNVGLVEFAGYHTSDVQDFLGLIGHSERLVNVSNVVVSSGASTDVNDESEVLLDIDTTLVAAPGASVSVYEGGFSGGGSFQSMFSAMIDGGVDVISNSWAYCENQTTLADVQSLDAILQTAAISGITVVSGAGDNGSTCLDGSPNTLSVPADVPHITAVGGTSATQGLLGSYGSETWWDGSTHTPPTGQGGFGLSQFFARPSYQNGLNAQAMRSVPDVVSAADPTRGVFICQADNGGCPNLLLYGGTSYAAPTLAAFVAVLNQRMGINNGFLNPLIYPLAGGSAFHALGNDFAHVGLGSPNLSELQRLLQGQSIGAIDTTNSAVVAYPPILVADGTTKVGVVVALFDANFHSVPGAVTTISANAGSHAVIAIVNGISDVNNGAARFTVTDDVAETVTLTATTGAGQLAQTAQITFVGPPAAFATIAAMPISVPANGTSTSTITVTLEDANHVAAPNKQVTIAQGAGRAKIAGPTPALTDGNGQITFAVADTFTEDVTFSATDVTDGNLAVPGSAQVSFTLGSTSTCNIGIETPAAGYAITSVVTGFTVDSNCVGASGFAWDPQGNLYAINYGFNGGDLYRFPAGSLPSVADAGTRITSTQYASGTCTHGLAFSKDGTHLYLARQFCGSGGDVVEISTIDGHIIRNVAPPGSIGCATGIATDPISGDLFVATPCGPLAIYRIGNPDSATPAAPVAYANSGSAIGLNFTADGTLWSEGYNPGGHVISVTGTNTAMPGTFTQLAVAPTHAGGVLPQFSAANPGSPAGLFVSDGVSSSSSPGSVELVDLTQDPPVISPVASGGTGQLFVVAGPDGCAYVSNADRIDRITAADGSCNFAPTSAGVRIVLSPSVVSPNPLQGAAQGFNAQLFNVATAAGQPLNFIVAGANNLVQRISADADGSAQFAYVGAHGGADTVRASTAVDGVTFVSNVVAVNWDAGKHTTGLTLNGNAGAAGSGSVDVSATLLDLSVTPFAPIAGATVQFTLGGLGCSPMTDAAGTASCVLAPVILSRCTLTADYAGDGSHLPANASSAFAPSADVIFVNGFQTPVAGCR